jgi:sulfate transporter 4
MTGASVTIALSQVKYILGIKIPRSDQLVESLKLLFSNLQGFNWREFTMGMSFIFLLLTFQFLARRVKKLAFLKALGPITVCIISIIVMNVGGYYKVPAAPPAPAPAPLGAAPAPAPKPPSAPIKSIGAIPKGEPRRVLVMLW